MKALHWLILFLVIVAGATLANLIALKIAADQVSSSVSTSPLVNLFGALNKR
jgi:hypothetical protein